MATDKTTHCKRCGSGRVGWVQSKKTGKWYLAFATRTHSVQVGSQRAGETGWHAHAHIPHDCTNPARGGYDACPLCKGHHHVPLDGPRADWCESYPNAPKAKGA